MECLILRSETSLVINKIWNRLIIPLLLRSVYVIAKTGVTERSNWI